MRYVAFVLALLLSACVTVRSFRTGTGADFPATDPDRVLVFFSVEDVGRPFEPIGEIMAEGSSGWGAEDSGLVNKSRKVAAKMGAHAIIVTKEQGAKAITAQLFGANDKKARIQAIRWKE